MLPLTLPITLTLYFFSQAAFGQSAVNAAPSQAQISNSYVQIIDGQFVIGCKTFFPAIWNQWEVIEASSGAPVLYGSSLPQGVTGPQLVASMMGQAASAGMSVMRAWASTVDNNYALQTAPGVYNEQIFRGLDYALDEASKNNIKMILVLVDYWQEGVTQYMNWTKDASAKADDFYTNAKAMGWYQDWLKVVTSRVNTINGRVYKEDPTIMAWDLINEPRCDQCTPGVIAKWIATMAKFLRSLDSNHLITTGEDGFYSTTEDRQKDNPVYQPGGTPWAQLTGQDFIADHSSPDIDFAVFHMWPDNWQTVREDFVRDWIAVHVTDAMSVLKKPVVMEEFGKFVKDRETYFQYSFDYALKWINNGSALKRWRNEGERTLFITMTRSGLQGLGFWEWYDKGQASPAAVGNSSGTYSITSDSPTWPIITKGMHAVSANGGQPVDGCTAASAPPAPGKNCSSSWVQGIPGSGFEGPNCDVDVDECVRGLVHCGEKASCINTVGSFQCKCWLGYSGDGNVCTATPALAELEESYTTDAYQGSLLCSVPYPSVGPGTLLDGTGFYARGDPSIGLPAGGVSPGPVRSAADCMLACDSAPGCSIAVYSPDSLRCILKGCPSKVATTCDALPPAGQPGSLGAPAYGPPAPQPPAAPPCTLAAELCQAQQGNFTNYFSKLRYNPACTTWEGNPEAAFGPSPVMGFSTITVAPSQADNITEASVFDKEEIERVQNSQNVALAPKAAASPPSPTNQALVTNDVDHATTATLQARPGRRRRSLS